MPVNGTNKLASGKVAQNKKKGKEFVKSLHNEFDSINKKKENAKKGLI
jgi:flagellar hook-basal body complex protein FliE